MNFRASFCDPFKKDIIEMGPIQKGNIVETFESIQWSEFLQKMRVENEKNIYFSPSLEIENTDNKNGLSISAVGDPDNIEWYIFFKRPREVKLLGLFKRINKNYITDITGQTKQDALDCLNALINNDLQFIEKKVK